MKILLKPLEWGIFANEFALLSSYAMIVGGFTGVIGMFSKWPINVFSLIIGIMVFVLEYPRSYNSSKFVERRYQHCFVPYIVTMGFFARSFYFRSAFYSLISIPCFFSLPSFIGGTCILTASIIYLIAAVNGFEWKQKPYELTCDFSDDNSSTTENTFALKETAC